MTISAYDPRAMLEAMRRPFPVRAFLRSVFFSGREPQTHTTEHIDVDILTATRRAAGYVNPHGAGQVVDRAGFTLHTFRPPTVAPKMPITVPDIQTRLPGEHVYEGDGRDRAQELLASDLRELDSLIGRREEIMIRDLLLDNQIRVLGDGVDRTIAFPARHADLTLGLIAAADRWDAGTADILAQIRDARRRIMLRSGLTADVAIVGHDAADALLANPTVLAQLHVRRAELGQLRPELFDSGAEFIGTLGGVDIWAYYEFDAAAQPLIPAAQFLMGATSARCELHYGAVGVADGEGDSAQIRLIDRPRVPESWVEREPAVRWLKVSARPLPVIVEANAVLTATVLA